LQVGLVTPHTLSRKQVAAYLQQPCPLLQSHMGHVIPQPAVYKHAILPAITHASEAWSTTISIRAKSKLQQIQITFLIYITKAYRTISHEALLAIAGIMPLDQAMHLNKDIRAISKDQTTNAVMPKLKKIEIPVKTRGIHPKDSHIRVDLSGTEGSAKVSIYTDGSKTENHVGASMVAVKNSTEIHTETQRLNITCTVFQAEFCGIIMAVDWIQNQRQKTSSYAINVDSKAALLAIANKHTTHPLAAATRLKTIELRKYTSITFHWVKGHAGLKGRLLGQNSRELLYCHRLRRNANKSRKADTGRILRKSFGTKHT